MYFRPLFTFFISAFVCTTPHIAKCMDELEAGSGARTFTVQISYGAAGNESNDWENGRQAARDVLADEEKLRAAHSNYLNQIDNNVVFNDDGTRYQPQNYEEFVSALRDDVLQEGEPGLAAPRRYRFAMCLATCMKPLDMEQTRALLQHLMDQGMIRVGGSDDQ